MVAHPLYDATARLEQAIEAMGNVRRCIVPRLPVAEAEALMDDVEDQIDALRAKFGAALDLLEAESARLHLAANDDQPIREVA